MEASGLWNRLRRLIAAPARDDWTSALDALADQLQQGPATLAGADAAPVLRCAGKAIRVEAGRARVSGAFLRRLITKLETYFKDTSTRVAFEGLVVEGPLLLNDLVFDRSLAFVGCDFRGTVEARMTGCRTLTLDDCVLAEGFDARVISLRGNLFLRRSRFDGPVLLRDGTVEGVVDCAGATFGFSPEAATASSIPATSHFGEAFGASRLRARALFWTDVRIDGSGAVTLRDAEVGSLRDDLAERQLASWPRAGALNMRGFRYERKNAAPLGTHLAWLKLEEPNLETNGRVLVSCLEAANAVDEAARLRIELRLHANRAETSRMRRAARGVYLRLQRLAFHPGKVLLLLAGVYIGAAIAVMLMQRYDLIVPVDSSLITNPCFERMSDACLGWTTVSGHGFALPRPFARFDGFSYALDLIFPYRPGGSAALWGGANTFFSLILLAIRVIGLALQASLTWSVLGNRDPG